ncbi:MAG: class I SAM-dependent methyltransferase [Flavobacteriaceae bacterium]
MSVLLKKSPFEGISPQELAQQLESRKKCEKKLPTWFSTPNIYYPKKLNVEQTSSEICARYKSEIVNGKTLVDLTGGWGVDSYFFSRRIDAVTHCEIDLDLALIAAHNFKVLGAQNIQTVVGDGLCFLRDSVERFDWVYLDPSRRDDSEGKVFRLSDCLPDVTANLELLFAKSNHVLLKAAPFLDITSGSKELDFVKEVHVVAVDNEVKELLWVLEKHYSGKIKIKTVNITKADQQHFDFWQTDEKDATCDLSTPLNYLYEPNAALLKSGAFKSVGNRFKVKKLHEHTHLYTSDKLLDFPGRRFEILGVIPYQKKTIKEIYGQKANVAARNFPESVAKIRKKLKLADGGPLYLFFVKDAHEKQVVLNCKRILRLEV